MCSGYCSTDVADISSGHGGQDASCFFSTQCISSVGLPGPGAYQAGGSGLFVGAHRTVRPHRSEVNTIRALMDLVFPRVERLGDGPPQVHRPWMVSTDSLASPDPVCSTDLLRSPSPCLNLDALYSDDTEDSVKLICGSHDGHTPVNSDQVLSDEDLPAAAGSDDRRQVIQIRDVSPDVQIVDISQVVRDWDSPTVWDAGHPKDCSGKRMQFASEDLGDSSVPLSPNRVQAGRSQEVPEDGSLFNVSPV